MDDKLEELRGNSDQLFILYKISSLLGSTNDPKELLDVILKEIVEYFDCNSASIALINPDTGMLELEVSLGLPKEYEDLQLPLSHGVTGWVALHGKPLLVPDVKKESRYFQIKNNIRSEAAVPMMQDNGIIGVINLDSTQVGAFNEGDIYFLELLSKEATKVVFWLWQNNQLKVKADQLRSIIKVGNSLISQLDLKEILKRITREARNIMGCQLCAIYLLSPDNKLKLHTISGAKGDIDYEEELNLNESSVGVAIERKKQVQVLNLARTEEHHFIPLIKQEGLVSLLASPIIYDDHVIGVINAYTNQQHRFNDDEKAILETLGSFGAVAIQNARLWNRVFESEESLRRNERLTTLGLIAAEIAHEIRNPLTVIKLLFESLEIDFQDDELKRRDANVIIEKLLHLETIVERVLDFGKTNEAVHSRCYLHNLIENTLLLVRLKLKQSKIELIYNPCKDQVWLDGNDGQLQQVLLNLILNALQAMPNGGKISISTETEAHETHENVIINFSDTGAGVPEDIRAKIFDSFLSSKREGAGLGLSIVKRILKSHNGDIELFKSSSEGTHFKITLPVAR